MSDHQETDTIVLHPTSLAVDQPVPDTPISAEASIAALEQCRSQALRALLHHYPHDSLLSLATSLDSDDADTIHAALNAAGIPATPETLHQCRDNTLLVLDSRYPDETLMNLVTNVNRCISAMAHEKALDSAHARLAALLQDEDASNETLRDAAITLCAACNAYRQATGRPRQSHE